jgi:hypothetical protein
VAPASNRNLLDFISNAIDPAGCAHIAYADDNTVKKLRVANQTSGCFVAAAVATPSHQPAPTPTASVSGGGGAGPPPNTSASPSTAPLVGVATTVTAWIALAAGRRRRRRDAAGDDDALRSRRPAPDGASNPREGGVGGASRRRG